MVLANPTGLAAPALLSSPLPCDSISYHHSLKRWKADLLQKRHPSFKRNAGVQNPNPSKSPQIVRVLKLVSMEDQIWPFWLSSWDSSSTTACVSRQMEARWWHRAMRGEARWWHGHVQPCEGATMVQRRGSPPVPLSLLPISISDMVILPRLLPVLDPGSSAGSWFWCLVLGGN